MIKRTRLASPPGRRAKDLKPSDDLLNYLKTDYPEQLPVSYLTAITKKYNKERVLHEEDKFIQRFVTQKGFVSTNKISEYLKNVPTHQRGQPLSEESVRRIYNNCANAEGKLTAQCLVRMANEVGVKLTDKEAIDMIKRYGKRKQHLSVEDCLRMNTRKRAEPLSKSLIKSR